MITLADEPTRRTISAPSALWRPWWLVALVVLGLWAQFVGKMSVDWGTNGQYEFGIFVPFLVAVLVWERWFDRPASGGYSRSVAWLALAIVFLALLPIRLIQEANPEWRPLNWIHAVVLIAGTLIPAYVAGGRSWVRHFLPAFVLLFMALPWTLHLEQTVIQSLARGVSAITAELLNWCGIPALRLGNVIEVPSGPVGVQDACTGIRSLAGSLMSSVFFGEYYRLRWDRRLLMVAGGLVIALGLNLVRTFFLCWIAGTRGVSAVDGWHDHAGTLIFGVSFGALWYFATWLRDSDEDDEEDEAEKAVSEKPSVGSRAPASTVPFRAAVIALVLLAASEFTTFAWYRGHESDRAAALSWRPVWPEQSPGFQFKVVSDEARAILRYSEGYSATVPFVDGREWDVFFFRWAPGRSSSQLAVLHRPEICLPAAGFRMVGTAAPIEVNIDGLKLPFQATVFESNGRSTYVYRTLWEERPTMGGPLSQGFDQSLRGRLLSVWHGQRNLGQQLLQVGISGVNTEEAARADLIRRLPSLIEVKH